VALVKVKCKKTKGNQQGFYLCNKEEVPKNAQLVQEETK